MASLSFLLTVFGFILLLLGIILFLKRRRIAGALVGVLRLCMTATPVLAFLYVWAAIR